MDGGLALLVEPPCVDRAGIRVLGDVALHAEHSGTDRAGMRLLAGVGPLEGGDVTLLAEPIGAGGAGIRLLASVGRLLVSGDVVLRVELLRAHRAGKWHYVGVGPLMPCEVSKMNPVFVLTPSQNSAVEPPPRLTLELPYQ